MKTFNMKLLACAVGGAMALAAASANASTVATAMIDMTNFEIKNATTGVTLNYLTDFDALVYEGSADTDVSYNALTDGNSVANTTNGVNLPPVCVGPDCGTLALGDNTFPVVSGPTTLDYSAADQRESDSPISNLPGFNATAGAEVGNFAAVSLADGTNEGSANSNNGLTAEWTFDLAADTALLFEFDVRWYLEAYVGAGEISPGKAEANYEFYFEISSIELVGDELVTTLVDRLAPSFLNDAVSASATGAAFAKRDKGVFPDGTLLTTGTAGSLTNVQLLSSVLSADATYKLTARINVNADAARTAVPEPSALALMGIGLLGIGAARIRRRYA